MTTVRLAANKPGVGSLTLFRLFGIQFTAHWSWVLLLGAMVYIAHSTFSSLRMGFSSVELVVLAIIAALLCVLSLYFHELAHAVVARSFGIPVRTISLFLLGGMAHVTRESPSPRAELLIAVVGPAASLGVGLVAAVVAWLARDTSPPMAALGLWLATMNIPLAIFNLVPAFPLDGGRVLRGMLWFAGQELRWASTVSARVGQVAAIGLLFSGVWILIEGTSGVVGGLWLIMIAWFMFAGATSSQSATLFQDSLRQLTVGSVMATDIGRVQADTSVQVFAEQHLLQKSALSKPQAFAVYRGDRLVGLLSLHQLGLIPVQRWSEMSIEGAMQPIEAAPSLEPGAPAIGALHLILEEGVEQIAVVAEGRLLGLVSQTELARASQRA